MIDRYGARPNYLRLMCLAQFAISYIYSGKLPKKTEMNKDPENDEFNCSRLKSKDQIIFNQNKYLPKYIALKDGLGIMRLRSYSSVLRIHDSRKKDQDHEKFYSELLLFSHWENEAMDLPADDEDRCKAKYLEKKVEIQDNREKIYPGESTIDLLESAELELVKPVHLADTLDCQGEQENDEDLARRVFQTTSNIHPKKRKELSTPQERSPTEASETAIQNSFFGKKIENEHRQENDEKNKKLLNH